MDLQPPAYLTASTAQTRRFALAFIVCSGLSVACGAIVMRAGGLPASLYLRNPAAWLVTLLLCAGLVRLRKPPLWTVWVLLAILALGFLGAGQAGVHRWIGAGPVQMNAAALVLPAALALAGADRGQGKRPGFVIAMILMAGMLAWQPDMSQLGALVAALLAWAAARRAAQALLWIAPMALVAIALCAWRPDPLAPIAHVEGILQMAWGASPMLALAGGACLLLAALSPLVLAADAQRRPQAFALAAYFVVSGAAWRFGAFPVPLVGYGLSFILGWGIGGAVLLMRSRTPREHTPYIDP